ncbi:phage tail protein [Undibacterium fentianense]|uniref:Phage tail protein n=1 Tax=Undibacterium fentianense TaxID=2828728 RepID=A0A941IDY5_9BURK|nr:tail fiber protein [Undibacterium fentianense]MBR7801814.1 phage tail protein [Undibacterium fentianense]
MAEPFLSEIRMFSFISPPKGWALCNGQLLPINQNQALFSLLGTTYGGDGRVTFGLPDLRGRVPIHAGNSYTLGQQGGEQAHTLSLSELPVHRHLINASNKRANLSNATNGTIAQTTNPLFSDLSPGSIYETSSSGLPNTNNIGGSQAHLNMQPFLTLSFCIALQGLFPSPY